MIGSAAELIKFSFFVGSAYFALVVWYNI